MSERGKPTIKEQKEAINGRKGAYADGYRDALGGVQISIGAIAAYYIGRADADAGKLPAPKRNPKPGKRTKEQAAQHSKEYRVRQKGRGLKFKTGWKALSF